MAAPNPQIRKSHGFVVPGSGGHIVGGGSPDNTALNAQVENAAELLRGTFGVAVEVRYNSNGRSGGAYVITDGGNQGIRLNSSLGINARLTGDESLVFNVYASEEHLLDPSLATCNGFAKYAYPELPSVADALRWIERNAKVSLAET